MYNEKIESLIKVALADGVLTEKEKQILFKRAQESGIDLDEFEMVLDTRLAEFKKQQKPVASSSEKLGKMRKCPACGALIGSFKMNCPDCGYEFNSIGANQYVEDFSIGLNRTIDSDKSKIKDSVWAGDYNMRVEEAAIGAEIRFVKAYPLPRTKEDCVEMLDYILPKISTSTANRTTKIWLEKYNAILFKMEQENKGELSELIASYRCQAKKTTWDKFRIWCKSLSQKQMAGIIALGSFLLLLSIPAGIFGAFALKDNRVAKSVEAGNIEQAILYVKKGGDSAPLYEYYMANEMFDEAELYLPSSYAKDYYNFCQRAVIYYCKENRFPEAQKFITRKIVYFEQYDEGDDWVNKEYNSQAVKKKLQGIVDGYK